MMSSGRPNTMTWGDSPTVLYVTPWDIPTNVLRTSPADPMKKSSYSLMFNSVRRSLPMSWGRFSETPWRLPKDVFMWFYKKTKETFKRWGHLYFVLSSIIVILLKWPPERNRMTLRNEGIRITCLKLKSKRHIIFSSKILSNCLYVLSSM